MTSQNEDPSGADSARESELRGNTDEEGQSETHKTINTSVDSNQFSKFCGCVDINERAEYMIVKEATPTLDLLAYTLDSFSKNITFGVILSIG